MQAEAILTDPTFPKIKNDMRRSARGLGPTTKARDIEGHSHVSYRLAEPLCLEMGTLAVTYMCLPRL